LTAHLALIRQAVRVIHECRPEVVIVQNFVIPSVERRVHEAARDVGATLVFVVHDHKHHDRSGGSNAGLRALLERSTLTIAHSEYVADRLGVDDVVVWPLPAQVGILPPGWEAAVHHPVARKVALHFGVVGRGYKGGDEFGRLAADASQEWKFFAAGVGATGTDRVTAINRFLSAAELVHIVEAATACVFPYRHASQSGAVALAQALGSVPVATAVGGLPEQIEHGVDGLLVEPDHEGQWQAALRELESPERCRELGLAARARAVRNHDRFTSNLNQLLDLVLCETRR
jgi:glycosyltransferase involved in cell wall biosynthesis